MKKIYLIIAILSNIFLVSAQENSEQINIPVVNIPQAPLMLQEYTLENGLEVYLLEDSSTPLIRVDFSVHAGFSSQTQGNAGFFKLYSKILQNLPGTDFFDEVQCNSDSSRYIFNTTPSSLESKLTTLSTVIFNPYYSDELLTNQLEIMKKEVTENSSTAASLINSAIDSKVFSDAPWKHDSGIYPSVFKQNTEKTARTTLKSIEQKYYTPQNCALFISGNINSEKLIISIRNIFGKYYSSYTATGELKNPPVNQQKKFVIHDSEFSTELTQVVVQYTSLDMEQSDLLSAALNNNFSTFKQLVLDIPELNIPGDEYINVAAAHKNDSSRIIFQTLMQPPENAEIQTNSYLQTEAFLSQIIAVPDTFNNFELEIAKNQLFYDLNSICSSSSNFMDKLSDFWAIKNYAVHNNAKNTALFTFPEIESPSAADFMERYKTIYTITAQNIFESYAKEAPYVFVIISDSDYKTNAELYKNGGYEEITSSNASWYVQKMYDNIRNQYKPDNQNYSAVYAGGNSSNNNNYYLKNLDQIKTVYLSNNIPVVYKKNDLNTGISLLINISGGKLNSIEDHGFEEVMINILNNMIQKEIHNQQATGVITGAVNVSASSQNYTSSILIECDSVDFSAVCTSVTSAMIYGNLPPAAADRAVNSRQYKKRLENGSAASQMYATAIQTLFGKTEFSKIYDTSKEILQKTNFTSILQAYPGFLDANRYSLIVTGSFEISDINNLENSFGQLGSIGVKINSDDINPVMKFPKNKSQKVQIIHTFLTDIPAEKAGPMPAVLIPTTEFLDPVLYFIKAPELTTSDESGLSIKNRALFNALLNYLGKILQEQIDNNTRLPNAKVQIILPKTNIPAGQITIMNVAHIKELDSEYKNAVELISSRLASPLAYQTIQQIKDYWIQTQMSETLTNTGTAELIQQGFEMYPLSPDPASYLKDYNNIQTATLEDFQQILPYFPLRPDYRLYSADGKN